MIKTYEIYCNSDTDTTEVETMIKDVIHSLFHNEQGFIQSQIKKPINVDSEFESLCYQLDVWFNTKGKIKSSEALEALQKLYNVADSIIELDFKLL